MRWVNKSFNNKILHVKVYTYDNELEFHLSPKTTGKTLFDMVASSIELNETTLFGLENYYINTNGQMQFTKWLKFDKRICSQKLSYSPMKQLKFLLHPKFFPEDFEQELIQPLTRHLFYLDVKHSLVRQSIKVNNTICGFASGHIFNSINHVTNIQGNISDNKNNNPNNNSNSGVNGNANNNNNSSSATTALTSTNSTAATTSATDDIQHCDIDDMSSSNNNTNNNNNNNNNSSNNNNNNNSNNNSSNNAQITSGSTNTSNNTSPPSDIAILLASLSAQAEYGDLNDTEVSPDDDEDHIFLPGRLLRLLPSCLLMQCQLSQDVARQIRQCYKSHKGMRREDAELAYLKIAHLYRLFGIEYFMITNKLNCPCWLGICAYGILIYPFDNRNQPVQSFSWKSIKNVSYKDKKFTIKLTTASPIVTSPVPLPTDLNKYQGPSSSTVVINPSGISTPRLDTPAGWIDPSIMSSTSMSTHLSALLFNGGGVANNNSNATATTTTHTPNPNYFATHNWQTTYLPTHNLTGPQPLPHNHTTPQGIMYYPNQQHTNQPQHMLHQPQYSIIAQPNSPTYKSNNNNNNNTTTTLSTTTNTTTNTNNSAINKDQLPLPTINNPACGNNQSSKANDHLSVNTSAVNCGMTGMSLSGGVVLATKLEVFLQSQQQSKLLIRLCRGNSLLYIKRRQPESHFIQQMRMQARSERARRDVEEARLNRANAEKQAALQAKAALEEKVVELEAALESCKTAGQLMAEKARYAQQEAALHEEQVAELTRMLPSTMFTGDNNNNNSNHNRTNNNNSNSHNNNHCNINSTNSNNNNVSKIKTSAENNEYVSHVNSSLPTLRQSECNSNLNLLPRYNQPNLSSQFNCGFPLSNSATKNTNKFIQDPHQARLLNNVPGTDPLSRRRFIGGTALPSGLNNSTTNNAAVNLLGDDYYSIKHLEIELQKEKARFNMLQNHFLSELREAYCHLEQVHSPGNEGIRQPPTNINSSTCNTPGGPVSMTIKDNNNNNGYVAKVMMPQIDKMSYLNAEIINNSPNNQTSPKFHMNSHHLHQIWQPGLDSWYEKKEFGEGPHFRFNNQNQVGNTNPSVWPPVRILDNMASHMVQSGQVTPNQMCNILGGNSNGNPMSNVAGGGPFNLSATQHSWTNDTPMMRKRVIGPLPSYYEMGGYVVNTSG